MRHRRAGSCDADCRAHLELHPSNCKDEPRYHHGNGNLCRHYRLSPLLTCCGTIPSPRTTELSFQFSDVRSRKECLDTQLSPLEFQPTHAGPFFDRNMGSETDPWVHDFELDKWQRGVLGQVDAKNSIFVVAPTSAGKTFIS